MMDDDALFDTMRTHLFSAVIGDVLDAAGLTRQFLPPAIRALRTDMVVAGRAMPVLEADCFSEFVEAEQRPNAFGLMFRALDDLKRHEVYITTGASPEYALWGGLMSTRATKLGAAGAVVNGYHRDTKEILSLGFPVFSMGSYAQDQRVRGRVIDFRCPLEFPNAVRVMPGDIIFGDLDGVVIIPKTHASEIVAAALAKVKGESNVRDMILAGETTQGIFEKTGIM
jgi:regulator of RNase E activity RraA